MYGIFARFFPVLSLARSLFLSFFPSHPWMDMEEQQHMMMIRRSYTENTTREEVEREVKKANSFLLAGKNLQTSLSLKRAPGVLTFLQIGWNITLPNQSPPLQFTLHLEEKTHRVYEVCCYYYAMHPIIYH